MRYFISSRPVAMTAVAVATVLAIGAGGLAMAGDASPGNTIRGCVNKASGVLRVAAHCSARERSLAWSQRGPAGRRGARGAQGPARAWTEFPVPPNTPIFLSSVPKTLEASPALPAGSFVASAAVTVFSSGVLPTVVCRLSMAVGPGTTDEVRLRLLHNQSVPAYLSVSGNAAAGTRVLLWCASAVAAVALDSQLTVIQVGTLQQN